MNPTSQASGNAQPSTTTTTSSADLQHLESYPWSSDPSFQAGLSAILETQGSRLDAPQLEGLVARARCFYFLRNYSTNIDPAIYLTWRASQPASALSPLLPTTATAATSSSPPVSSQASTANGTPAAAPPASDPANTPTPTPTFDEIVALIQSGQPIPGIRDIPDTVLIGQGSTTTTPARRKPWERSENTERTTGMTTEEESGTGTRATAVAGPAPGRGSAGQDMG